MQLPMSCHHGTPTFEFHELDGATGGTCTHLDLYIHSTFFNSPSASYFTKGISGTESFVTGCSFVLNCGREINPYISCYSSIR
jgi:hypothetical protein